MRQDPALGNPGFRFLWWRQPPIPQEVIPRDGDQIMLAGTARGFALPPPGQFREGIRSFALKGLQGGEREHGIGCDLRSMDPVVRFLVPSLNLADTDAVF